jgi:hypothetical protein
MRVMSIISEALKKAEQRSQGAKNRPKLMRSKTLPRNTSLFTFPTYLFIFVLVATGIGYSLVQSYPERTIPVEGVDVVRLHNESAHPNEELLSPKLTPASAQFLIEEAPRLGAVIPRPSHNPLFNLSGIAYDDKGYMAVVNGDVVRVGDWIQNAKVKSISSRKIELEHSGKKVVIEKTF